MRGRLSSWKNCCLWGAIISIGSVTDPNVTLAAPDSTVIVVFDGRELYSFGSLRVIPIDTMFIEPDLCQFLDSCGADSVGKVFPDAQKADSVLMRPSGTTVRLPDLWSVFRIYFSESVDVDRFDSCYTLIDTLSTVDLEFPQYEDGVYPNDPYFDDQVEYLGAPSSAGGKINAVAGWHHSRGNAGVLIGIIDSGIDSDHPDLLGRIADGTD